MAPPESSAAVPVANPASGRRCVLIVEDNPLNMKLFGAMIASLGYDVLQATDGREGLAMAQQHQMSHLSSSGMGTVSHARSVCTDRRRPAPNPTFLATEG